MQATNAQKVQHLGVVMDVGLAWLPSTPGELLVGLKQAMLVSDRCDISGTLGVQ
jgi:hypothetical protein